MAFEKLVARRGAVCVPHSWREAYASALKEPDPGKLIGRIEYAITAIERRYAQWGTDPGTPAEWNAIRECISALERLVKQKRLATQGAVVSIAPPGERKTVFTEARSML